MKTFVIECYQYDELSDEAKKVALKKYQDEFNHNPFIPSMDEIMDSMKELIKSLDFKLRNYSIGAYTHSFLTAECENDSWKELSGRRAFAFVENHLFQHLRIPWKGKKRWEMAKYNAGYRSCHPPQSFVRQSYSAGRVPPCPLTGMCFDNDFIDHLMEKLREGYTVKEAIESLAEKASDLLENECESVRSEAYFIEQCNINDTTFNKDGIEMNLNIKIY